MSEAHEGARVLHGGKPREVYEALSDAIDEAPKTRAPIKAKPQTKTR